MHTRLLNVISRALFKFPNQNETNKLIFSSVVRLVQDKSREYCFHKHMLELNKKLTLQHSRTENRPTSDLNQLRQQAFILTKNLTIRIQRQIRAESNGKVILQD